MKRMLPWLIVALLAVTLIVGAAFVLWNEFVRGSLPDDPREAAREKAGQVDTEYISAERLASMTYAIEDIVTNLADPAYFVNVSFAFELDSVKAREEFQLLEHKVRDVINTTLADIEPDSARGSAGIDAITSALLNRTNELLRAGKVRHIYVTKFIVTQP